MNRGTFKNGYGGIWISGGQAAISDNVFDGSSYGVYDTGSTDGTIIENNQFLNGPALPVDLEGAHAATVRRNTILGNGQVGIQLNSTFALVEGNVFMQASGYKYGSISATGGSCRIRRNQCQNGPIHGGIYVSAFETADLGTGADPGGNTFMGKGPSIMFEGAGTITAIGNAFPQNPPVCGTDIVLTDGGSVVFGSDAGQACPQ
jgi:hypothetical protein